MVCTYIVFYSCSLTHSHTDNSKDSYNCGCILMKFVTFYLLKENNKISSTDIRQSHLFVFLYIYAKQLVTLAVGFDRIYYGISTMLTKNKYKTKCPQLKNIQRLEINVNFESILHKKHLIYTYVQKHNKRTDSYSTRRLI